MRLQFASQIIINPASRSSLSRALPGHLSEVHLSKSATKKVRSHSVILCFTWRLVTSAADFDDDYPGTGMPRISDLPLEILELIFSHLISISPHLRSGYHRLHRAYFEAPSAAYLRLVCRAWADWLYEHHLYRTLTFDSAHRSLAFIELIGRRSSRMLPRAKCQDLEVDYLLGP
jgi:hypothetical protein